MKYNITKEAAMIAVIMGETVMKRMYEAQGIGYVEIANEIAEWAVEFEKKFRDVDDWSEFSDSYTPLALEGVCDWADIVVDYAEYKFQNL